jgi:hypothetical protein
MLTVRAGSAVVSSTGVGEDVGSDPSAASGRGEELAGSTAVAGDGSVFGVVASAASGGGEGLAWSTVVVSMVVGTV